VPPAGAAVLTVGEAFATANDALVAGAREGLPATADACSVFAPAESIDRPENAAVPFPAAVPTSIVVVPESVPVPDATEIVTFREAPSPTVEVFPKLSSVFKTGCCPKTAPTDANPGWVVNTSCVATAGATSNAELVDPE
jgi:hypothetical protein